MKTNIKLSGYECTHIMGVMPIFSNITCFKNEICGLLAWVEKTCIYKMLFASTFIWAQYNMMA